MARLSSNLGRTGARDPVVRWSGRQPGKKGPRAENAMATLRKIWAYLQAFRGWLALILFMVIASSVLGLLGPYLVGVAIDHFLLSADSIGLVKLLLLLAAVYVLYSVSVMLQNYWMIGVAQKTVYRMRNELFVHLHKLPVAYYISRQNGEIMSRLTNDIENVSQTLNSSFIQLFSSLLTFVGMLTLMLWLSPLLTLVTLSVVPFMYVGMKWITSRTGGYFKEQQRNLGELNGFIEETFSGQKIVKAFSQESRVTAEFIAKSKKLKASGYWSQAYSGFIPKLMNVLNNMSFSLIAGAGGIMVINGMTSIGVIVTFTEYARQFIRPLNDLANQFNTFLSAIAGAERVFQVLEAEPEEIDEQDAVSLQTLQGEIHFVNVSFAYGGEEPTLHGIDFHVKPGQTVALVGPTGAGKTTIVQLLSRFYDPKEGHIFMDGHDLTGIKRNSLRQHMGFVLQESFLFQDTIRENIRYGKLTASDEEVEQAAQLANAHSFIVKLPDGYDTVLQHDGGGISQGQKQLIAIARAFLASPSLLVLDEATSSIDTITELKIQEALYRLMEGRTSIVIAHRLNTIRRADQILVIEDGRIIERGNHQSLLAERGFYYGLYHSAEREAEAETVMGDPARI